MCFLRTCNTVAFHTCCVTEKVIMVPVYLLRLLGGIAVDFGEATPCLLLVPPPFLPEHRTYTCPLPALASAAAPAATHNRRQL